MQPRIPDWPNAGYSPDSLLLPHNNCMRRATPSTPAASSACALTSPASHAGAAYLDRPNVAKRLVRLLVIDGLGPAAAAKAISTQHHIVTHQAVNAWIRRHAGLLLAARSRASQELAAAVDLSIAERPGRLDVRQSLFDGILALIDARGGLATGAGLLVEDVKWVGIGANRREFKVKRFDAALIAQLRGLLEDTAAEFGQIPRPSPLPVETKPTAALPWEKTARKIYCQLRQLDPGKDSQITPQENDRGEVTPPAGANGQTGI